MLDSHFIYLLHLYAIVHTLFLCSADNKYKVIRSRRRLHSSELKPSLRRLLRAPPEKLIAGVQACRCDYNYHLIISPGNIVLFFFFLDRNQTARKWPILREIVNLAA